MKIGLVRHFKVNYSSYSPFYFPGEFRTAMKRYDEADVIPAKTDLCKINWELCFASSLKRAAITARTIFKKEIIETDLLREVSLLPFTEKNLKLPWFVWHIGARVAWSKNAASQEETKEETAKRINLIYSKIIETGRENILVVSHGFFMKVFSNFLSKKGFEGKIDPFPRNGQLYLFQKN
jgi:broad specificity phosphatase PhoE